MLCRARLSPGDRSLSGVCTLVSLWVQEGCVEGLPRHQSCELPDPWSGVGRTRDAADRPGCRAGDSPQAPWAREEPTEEAAPRTSEGSACGCRTPPLAWTLRCPSFTNPAARRGHQIPCIFCPCVNNKGGSGLGKRRKNTFKIIFLYLCHVL